MGKTHRKNLPQARARTTRSSKPRLVLSDPSLSSAQLDSQLRSLGLYAAHTIGDGNCLFRALSDQLYGSPSKHPQLRQQICDYISKHKSRYEPFVDDERGLDVHVRCMRENGTYGGHMELSAFAAMVKRDVKVIQPGLVYVIEWAAGLDEDEREKAEKELERELEESEDVCRGTVYVAYHDWEHFSSIRNLKGPHTGLPNVTETPPAISPVVPTMTPKEREKEAKKERERERKEKEKGRKIPRVKLKLSAPSPVECSTSVATNPPPSATPSTTLAEQDATLVPLPESRAGSTSRSATSTPAPDNMTVNAGLLSATSSLASIGSSSMAQSQSSHSTLSSDLTSTSFTSSSSSFTTPYPPGLSNPPQPLLPHSMRVHRSPKRSFDESTSSEDGASHAGDSLADDGDGSRERGRDKRARVRVSSGGYPSGSTSTVPPSSTQSMVVDADQIDTDSVSIGGDKRDQTPGLSAPGSSSSSSSSASVLEEDEVADIVENGINESGEEEEEEESSLSEPPSDDEQPASISAPVPSRPLSKNEARQQKRWAQSQSTAGRPGRQYADMPLTRRQRKALGLPKPRAALVFGADNNSPGAGRVPESGAGAGKIIIPGGRFKGRGAVKVREFREGETQEGDEGEGEVQEWVRTGVGRVDVRGFRELKI